MRDITYTVLSADFNDPANALLHICIPVQDPADAYIFENCHNISRMNGLKKINALLIVMKKAKNNDELSSTGEFHTLQTSLIPSKGHPDAVSFNKKAKEILILIYHDDDVKDKDIDKIFSKVSACYEEVKKNGSGNERLPKKTKDTPPKIIPRKLGMSLIKK